MSKIIRSQANKVFSFLQLQSWDLGRISDLSIVMEYMAHNRKSVGHVEKNESLEGLGWHTMEAAEEGAWTPDFLPPDAMCFSPHQDHEISFKTYAICLIEKLLGFHNKKAGIQQRESVFVMESL